MTKPFALIVEDSSIFSLMFSRMVEDEFEVEVVADGDDAITRLKEVTPHLILLDLHLPGASGRKVLNHIKSDERFVKTRIILTTSDERQAEELRDSVDIVLLKPINPSHLRQLASRMKSD